MPDPCDELKQMAAVAHHKCFVITRSSTKLSLSQLSITQENAVLHFCDHGFTSLLHLIMLMAEFELLTLNSNGINTITKVC